MPSHHRPVSLQPLLEISPQLTAVLNIARLDERNAPHIAGAPRLIGKIRYFTNNREAGPPSAQHIFSFRAVNTVFSDARTAWHANCLRDFRLCK